MTKIFALHQLSLPLSLIRVWYGHENMVKDLLASGAEPNTATAKGETSLMFAAFRNLPAVMALLLDCGANPALRNANGDGALALAAGCGNSPECVKLLLKVKIKTFFF